VTDIDCPIVELRQYRLHPGRRDDLIELFDTEFVESQETVGMTVLGQFRDLSDPDRFVWLRGFADMATRARALADFYGGPVWAAHRDAANATMIAFDDVLLLRPVPPGAGFPAPAPRPEVGFTAVPPTRLLATVLLLSSLCDEAFLTFFEQEVRPVLAETGGTPIVCLRTEPAENTFPALPVRTGENAFVWFAAFADQAGLDEHRERLASCARWRDDVRPALVDRLAVAPHELLLAPTARSLLR
jgi:hypothetical protein